MPKKLATALIVLASLVFTGCTTTVANRQVRSVEMPTLKDNAVRPKVFLDVQGYSEYSGGRLPEQDVNFKREIQDLFTLYSTRYGLFSSIEKDPWFAQKADYRIEIEMFAGKEMPGMASAMVSGMSQFIIPLIADNKYSAKVRVFNKNDKPILSASDSQKERSITGFAAVPLMVNTKAKRNWEYSTSEEYLTVRIIRELMNSSMFAPKPVVAKPKSVEKPTTQPSDQKAKPKPSPKAEKPTKTSEASASASNQTSGEMNSASEPSTTGNASPKPEKPPTATQPQQDEQGSDSDAPASPTKPPKQQAPATEPSSSTTANEETADQATPENSQ